MHVHWKQNCVLSKENKKSCENHEQKYDII